MPESISTLSQKLSDLPPEWLEDLLPAIREQVRTSGRKLVVLDDDPTGTQTVHGLPVLTTWSVEDLQSELNSAFPAFYVLTNSRSLSQLAAEQLSREIGSRLKQAAINAHAEIEVISRSDSTLRGHFPAEVDALMQSMGTSAQPCIIIPFFLEGGRFTLNDTHYVAEGDRLVPAAQTPYAKDSAFGYRCSDLRRWVEEKTGGRIPFHKVESLSIEDLRRGGPQRVAERLLELPACSCCVVNAASYRDLEVFVSGLLAVEVLGRRFVFRTAASFVRVRAGIVPRGLLSASELMSDNRNGGLFVVGSYVPKTSAQLALLRKTADIACLEVDVFRLLNDDRRFHEIERVTDETNRMIRTGRDVALFTSRDLVSGIDGQSSLGIGQRVSEALIAIVQGLDCQPRYLVAKGGITSSDVATRGLGVRRAMILGQVLPGVPAWKLGHETRYPGMAYIVFPGNVGKDDALVEIRKRLAPVGLSSQPAE
jgi:uncharacterized protein YgbK (DUF1537 family)